MTRILVTGAMGLLGLELVRVFRSDGDEVIDLGRDDLDLEDPQSMHRIDASDPDVVINAAAWTDVDACARDPARAMRINGVGPGLVAKAAARSNALVVQISTNEVFEGANGCTYSEDDSPGPVNPYGASKLAGERAVANNAARHLIVRTAWLYSHDRGFPARIRAAADRLASNEPLRVVDDEWGNPTPVASLAPVIVASTRHALKDESLRVIHLAGEPPTTRYDWAALALGDWNGQLERIKRRDYSRASTVPEHAVLSTARAHTLGLPPIRWHPSNPETA